MDVLDKEELPNEKEDVMEAKLIKWMVKSQVRMIL